MRRLSQLWDSRDAALAGVGCVDSPRLPPEQQPRCRFPHRVPLPWAQQWSGVIHFLQYGVLTFLPSPSPPLLVLDLHVPRSSSLLVPSYELPAWGLTTSFMLFSTYTVVRRRMIEKKRLLEVSEVRTLAAGVRGKKDRTEDQTKRRLRRSVRKDIYLRAKPR